MAVEISTSTVDLCEKIRCRRIEIIVEAELPSPLDGTVLQEFETIEKLSNGRVISHAFKKNKQYKIADLLSFIASDGTTGAQAMNLFLEHNDYMAALIKDNADEPAPAEEGPEDIIPPAEEVIL